MNLPELIVANCVSINDRTDLAQIRIVKIIVTRERSITSVSKLVRVALLS